MSPIIHIAARFFLLLSIAVAPLNGVQASMVMDMDSSQGQVHINQHDMSQMAHGGCDMAEKGGCQCDTDCQSECSTCSHCNIAGNLSAVILYQNMSDQGVLVMSDLRLGIVLPLEKRPPQLS